MKGDIINVEDYHRRAARAIVDRIEPEIRASERPFTMSVAGESGSGKSETGKALADECASRGLNAFVFQQDDYFVLPPESNDQKRRDDISWVGTQEVRLSLLDEHLEAAKQRSTSVVKPLVDYDADRIGEETVDLSRCDAVIAEGTYTTLLDQVDCRIFIDRNRFETLESRKKRGREPVEPFMEQVLEIEHRVISAHKSRADVIIDRGYEVEFARG